MVHWPVLLVGHLSSDCIKSYFPITLQSIFFLGGCIIATPAGQVEGVYVHGPFGADRWTLSGIIRCSLKQKLNGGVFGFHFI